MIGARALLAFRGSYERDPEFQEEPSDDALLGAIMESQFQAAMVLLMRGFYRLFGG